VRLRFKDRRVQDVANRITLSAAIPDKAGIGECRTKVLLELEAYRDLRQRIGACGIVSFAEASIAVPFVGAAAGAHMIAQVIRLESLETAPLFMQMELGSPEMNTPSARGPKRTSAVSQFAFYDNRKQKSRLAGLGRAGPNHRRFKSGSRLTRA
jgi:hypothetical protein